MEKSKTIVKKKQAVKAVSSLIVSKEASNAAITLRIADIVGSDIFRSLYFSIEAYCPDILLKLLGQQKDYLIGRSAEVLYIELKKKYLHSEIIKNDLENHVSVLTSLELKKVLTLLSLASKVRDIIPDKTIREHIEEFGETQIIPDLSMDFFKPTFKTVAKEMKKFLPKDYNSFSPSSVFSKGSPIFITSGTSFPKKTFPNIYRYVVPSGRTESRLYRLLSIIDAKLSGDNALKLSFVPKNYKSYRTIAIPNREAVALQLPLNTYIRAQMTKDNRPYSGKLEGHHVSFTDQTINQRFIMNAKTASIDLSSASDRVYRDILNRMVPDLVTNVELSLPEDFYINTPKEKVRLNSIGAQGLPLTFTIMALLVHCIARSHTSFSSTYGDDLIVRHEDFGVRLVLAQFGLVVNSNKSFALPNFAESCGVHRYIDYTGSVTDITPAYLRNLDRDAIISFLSNCANRKILELADIIKISKKVLSTFVISPYEAAGCICVPGSTNFYVFNMSITLQSLYQCRHLKVPYTKYELNQIDGFSESESKDIISSIEWMEYHKTPLNFRIYPNGEKRDNPKPHLSQLALYALGYIRKPLEFKALSNDRKYRFHKVVAYIRVLSEFGWVFERGSTPQENHVSDRDKGFKASNFKLRFNVGSYKAVKGHTFIPIWDLDIRVIR